MSPDEKYNITISVCSADGGDLVFIFFFPGVFFHIDGVRKYEAFLFPRAQRAGTIQITLCRDQDFVGAFQHQPFESPDQPVEIFLFDDVGVPVKNQLIFSWTQQKNEHHKRIGQMHMENIRVKFSEQASQQKVIGEGKRLAAQFAETSGTDNRNAVDPFRTVVFFRIKAETAL